MSKKQRQKEKNLKFVICFLLNNPPPKKKNPNKLLKAKENNDIQEHILKSLHLALFNTNVLKKSKND